AVLSACLVFGGLALTYDVQFGFTGLLSFGHALYIAVGVYLSNIAITDWHWGFWPAILFTMAVAFVLATVLGFVSLRVSGIAFAMVTLAFVLAAAGGIVYMLIYNGSTLAVTQPNFTLTLLLMVVIGGAGSRWGAVLGGILYTYMNDRLIAIGSSSTVEGLPHALRTPLEQPLFLLGIVFILIVVFLPGGLTGLVHRGR